MSHIKIFIDGIMHLGDMIMSSSVIPVLKKAYPDSEIIYLATANLAYVASFFEGIDQVIPYTYQSKGGYMDVYRMGKMLRKYNFDIGISLDPRERVTLMKWFAHIPIRISMEQALGWKLGWEKWFYTNDLSFSDGWNYKEHRMSESFQHLMCLYTNDSEMKFIPLSFRPSSNVDMQTATQLLKPAGNDKKKIAFCVATTDGFKDWPSDKFSVIADWLIEKYNSVIIMTGIPKHANKVYQIIEYMNYKDSCINVVGKTSFSELIALFRQIDLVLTLDTGTSHIAGAAGCPVITIFTHNSPAIYKPAGEYTGAVSAYLPCSGKHICIGPRKCKKNDCVEAVTVSMVQKEISRIMEMI